ncbi:MAG: ribosome biogenesis GTPase Der [Eubacteriales bacterium]|nr:ribosome biogenesis GTPase Der [Eubacteriales bacterium]
MSKPIAAIVGRPNVGKSTFFNMVIGKRLSIVEDTPGVTRDRIYAETEWSGVEFALIDTGGIERPGDDVILSNMRAQAQEAIDMADVIIFMVDGKEGLTSADDEVANMLRRTGKKVILLVNKIDNINKMHDTLYDFYQLGIGEPIPVSALNKLNIGDVLDEIISGFPDETEEDEEDRTQIAIIGKPNAGKSSLVNALLKEERVIVSPIPGTTRDSIDTEFSWNGEEYTLIDTAGIRRRNKVYDNVERYSIIRSVAAIERSDVCVMMIDAADGVTEQDKRIVGIAHEAGKGIVIAVNKWDLIEKETNTMKHFTEKVRDELPFLSYAPIIFISVKDNLRVQQVMERAAAVSQNCALRVPTGRLNSIIEDAVLMQQPPSDKGKHLKIYYVSQIGVKPPLFSFQINDRDLLHFSYSRYLENKIRAAFGFEGTSIKFVFREKHDNEV